MPQKCSNGKWKVDERPNGAKGKRIRKTFNSHAEAARFEAFILGQAAQNLPWNPAPRSSLRLSVLVAKWFELHGTLLSDGERRLVILNNVTDSLGDPIAHTLTEADFMKYRANSDRAPKTLNNQLGYLNAVFNKLKRAKVIDYPSPLQSLEFIKYERREMEYLELDQIDELLDATQNDENKDVYLCTWLCLDTGARWGEGETMKRVMVRQKKGGYSVTFTDTKGKKTRTVPIRRALYDALRKHNAPNDRVFERCMRQFNRVSLNLSFKFPPRQNTHILRHTFASHFIMNGGNILVLQKILGHKDIKETMRYAHLAPGHLETAITLGPMGGHKVDIQQVGDKKVA